MVSYRWEEEVKTDFPALHTCAGLWRPGGAFLKDGWSYAGGGLLCFVWARSANVCDLSAVRREVIIFLLRPSERKGVACGGADAAAAKMTKLLTTAALLAILSFRLKGEIMMTPLSSQGYHLCYRTSVWSCFGRRLLFPCVHVHVHSSVLVLNYPFSLALGNRLVWCVQDWCWS